MAVRKKRNHNKAHSNNTLSLHTTFQIQLALLLALCNMLTRIPCKSHNLILVAPIKSLNPITSFSINWVLSVQYVDKENSSKKVRWQDDSEGHRSWSHSQQGPEAGSKARSVSGTSDQAGYSGQIRPGVKPNKEAQANRVFLFPGAVVWTAYSRLSSQPQACY